MENKSNDVKCVPSTILRMQSVYETLGTAGKKIADWIMENPRNIIKLSISELAEECKVSEATVVRFSRKLGYRGYQELKIAIAQETVNDYTLVNEKLSENDSFEDIINKVFFDIENTLDNTKKILDYEKMTKAAEAISNAKNVAIFGLGNSASIAYDYQHKFMRLGIKAVAYNDNHMQAIAASHLTNKDVAIGISHSGSSIDVVDALKISKERGAKTICITNYGKSPILNNSDITLFTVSNETKYRIFGMASRIAQLAILDSIYTYIALNNRKVGIEEIKRTEKALQSKKY